MSKGIRWKDEEAQVEEDDEGKSGGDEEIRGEDNFQIQFRLHDGSDIGPTTHSAETTIGNLKGTILPQWPPGQCFFSQFCSLISMYHAHYADEYGVFC